LSFNYTEDNSIKIVYNFTILLNYNLACTVAITNAYPRELHAYRDITRARASSLHIRYDCSKSGNVVSKLFNHNLKRVINILIYSTRDMFDT